MQAGPSRFAARIVKATMSGDGLGGAGVVVGSTGIADKCAAGCLRKSARDGRRLPSRVRRRGRVVPISFTNVALIAERIVAGPGSCCMEFSERLEARSALPTRTR
jgi:hypothetical protein